MARYIDIEGAGIGRANREQFLVPEFADGWNAVLKILEKEPTADVVEVKHGEWKQGVPYVCSICGKPASEEKNTSERYSCWLSPYCPNCGAKMDSKDTNVPTK